MNQILREVGLSFFFFNLQIYALTCRYHYPFARACGDAVGTYGLQQVQVPHNLLNKNNSCLQTQ